MFTRLDSKALAALRAIPGIDTALKKLLAVTGESAIRVTFMASAVKVTPTAMSRSAREIADRLHDARR